MFRYYVHTWDDKSLPNDRVVYFEHDSGIAFACKTWNEAERIRLVLNRNRVSVRLVDDGIHICEFQIEGIAPEKFLLYCDTPSAIKKSDDLSALASSLPS